MKIDELIPLRSLSDEEKKAFFALQESPTGRLIQFSQRTEQQRWTLRFVSAAICVGLPTRIHSRTGWKHFVDPVHWAANNWNQIGGNPDALRLRTRYRSNPGVKKSHWRQLDRRYNAATWRYGRWIWIAKDGRYIFAQGNGGEGAGGRWDMREAMDGQ